MIQIRCARTQDSEPLTDLATRSEAHWGYDDAFLAAFRDLYRITEAFIKGNRVFVAEGGGQILGFYALAGEAEALSLEYMYLEPSCLGRGLGRLLWEHMITQCRLVGAPEIHLVCGPEPKAFYLKMGAVQTGETESLVVPGRRVARLAFQVPRT